MEKGKRKGEKRYLNTPVSSGKLIDKSAKLHSTPCKENKSKYLKQKIGSKNNILHFNSGRKIKEHSQTAETFTQVPKVLSIDKTNFLRSVRDKLSER